MRARRVLASVVLVLVAWGIPSVGPAQWVEFGVPVCQLWGDQWYPEMVPDGQGGAIVVYETGDSTDIYAQRLDGYGNALWAANGVVVCNWASYQARPCVVADGQGGAVVAWFDWRNGNTDIYAQRIDQNGNRLWATGGVALCTQTSPQWYPRCASDGAGGAIVAWKDERGADADIYAQRIDAGGAVRWTADGVQLTNAAGAQDEVQVIADGFGGAIFVWQGGDLALQRVNALGAVQWTSAGRVIAAAATSPYYPAISAVTPYGIFLAWEARNGAPDDGVYAQRVDLYGNPRWTGGGVLVNDQPNDQELPVLVTDGQGGVIIAWLDRRAGSGTTDIYAQKLSQNGVAQWTATGAPVCVDASMQYYPQVVSDGAGGAIVGWYDDRSGYDDIFAQRLDAGGAAQWVANGLPVAVAHQQQFRVRMLPDGIGGALMTWMDTRAENRDIYAQRVDRFGFWGYPAPRAHAATDVPGDEGGRLTLAWDASRLDPWPEQQISHYTLWKSLTAAAAQELLAAGARLLAGPEALPRPAVLAAKGAGATALPAAFILPPPAADGAPDKEGASYYWELVGTREAYHLPSYAATLDTDCDSTAVAPCEHHFQVIAHGEDPAQYWIGAPASGHSVDNLAPAMLTGLTGAGSYGPPALTVAWDPSPAADLSHYVVHRGPGPDFVPGEGTLIAAPADTFFVDAAWDPSGDARYKVAAVDVHGNTGPWALLPLGSVSGVDDAAPPPAAALRQNVPNPFNPRTTLRFELPNAGRARLAVYDVAGRLVRVLEDADLPAGSHDAEWDGTDATGRALASGGYYARLESAGTVATVRMVLVR